MILSKLNLITILLLSVCVASISTDSKFQEDAKVRFFDKIPSTDFKVKLPICFKCRTSSDCKSGKCWGSPARCVKNSDYHWLLICRFKRECADCSSSIECATKKCWGPGGGVHPKCTFDTSESKDKCFPKPKKEDCAPCSSGSECASGKCWGSPRKCVSSSDYKWLRKCGFKSTCERCHSSLECATKKCDDGVCVKRSSRECKH